MILKEIDSKKSEINQLNELLKLSHSKKQKNLIRTNLTLLENGYKAEKNNAYYIDFYAKDNKHNFVLHDIRINYKNRTAQIDHLIISRFGIEILESKSFTGTLTINKDGSLSVKYKNEMKTFPNPIEQNNRHAKVLNELIMDKIELPSNVKLFGGIPISSKILINPNTTISNKILPKDFVRADSFFAQRTKEIDKMGVATVFKALSKFMTMEKAREIANLLIAHHEPVKFDYFQKYHIARAKNSNNSINTKPMSTHIKEAVFLKQVDICKTAHKDIFLCSKCKSPNLEMRHKYTYYFKCLFCGGNTPIHLTCSTDKCKPKIKKRKNNFYKICEVCNTEELFFTNK